MTLRDHLAVAAAQIEIPDWFKPALPDMPTLPEVPAVNVPYTHVEDKTLKVNSILWATMSRFLKKLMDGEDPEHLDLDYPTLQSQFGMPAEAVDAVYGPFYASVKPYREALQNRAQLAEEQRIAQWPLAYADMVIAARRAAK